MVDPLTQRLNAYRFAWLMVDPKPLETQFWQEHRLTRLPSKGGQAIEKLLLSQLPESPPRSNQILASTSLTRLKRVRLMQSDRRLVWICPYTYRPAPLAHLCALGSTNNRFPISLDMGFPLIWASQAASQCKREWRPLLPYALHPRMRLQRWLTKHRWRSFTSEAGEIALQSELFRQEHLPPWSGQKWHCFDHMFLRTLHQLPLRCYVLSIRARHIQWFAQDAKRLLSARVWVKPWDTDFHDDDPRPIWNTINVMKNPTHNLNPSWPCIYLDQIAGSLTGGVAGWIDPIAIEARVTQTIERQPYSLSRSKYGWHLSFSHCAYSAKAIHGEVTDPSSMT